MRSVTRLALVLGGLCVIAVALAAAIPRRSVESPPSPWIYFKSTRDRAIGGEYRMRPDGRGVELVRAGFSQEPVTVWSPDGTQRAVVDLAPVSHIVMMSADADARITGPGARPLVPQLSNSFYPAWSPDGQWIAFSSATIGISGYAIYRVRPDGSDLLRLSPADNDHYPAWSADSQWIIFASSRGNGRTTDLYRMRPDGSDVARLTNTPASELYPAPSPDGQWIAYSITRRDRNGNGQQDIYRMRPDGSGVERLTFAAEFGLRGLSWAPEWAAPLPDRPLRAPLLVAAGVILVIAGMYAARVIIPRRRASVCAWLSRPASWRLLR